MYEAIGHMLCQWAHLEQAMNDSLFELGGATTDDAQRRLGQQQFKTRLDKWQELIAPHVKRRLKRGALNVFCARVSELKAERDEIAHGYWGIDEGCATLFKFKYALLVDLIEMDEASVQRLASRISILNARLFCLKGLYEQARQLSPPPHTPETSSLHSPSPESKSDSLERFLGSGVPGLDNG